MSKRNVRTQISNVKTVDMYKKQMISLACNVFNFKNLLDVAPFMDLSYVNRELVHKGSIAFFNDEYLGLLALPYVNMGRLDLYGRPIDIQVIGKNGYTRQLKYGEYVIMYDNMIRYPLIFDILQYSERIASIQRTIDINIAQQRTPRIWKTKTENLKTIQDVMDGIDANNEAIVTYDTLELEDTSAVIAPAPFVSDKLSEQKDKLWNEFLRLIGIANTSFQKKERNIQDEVFISQAGTIASRYTRFEARYEAITKINEKWGYNLEVEYYDGLPTTLSSPSDEYETIIESEESDDERVE
jgi:hypothetical protein